MRSSSCFINPPQSHSRLRDLKLELAIGLGQDEMDRFTSPQASAIGQYQVQAIGTATPWIVTNLHIPHGQFYLLLG